MVLCIVAFFVFSAMSIFSAKYRPLARESLRCVFRTIMLKPCDTSLDDRIKAEVISGMLKRSPTVARILNRHFFLVSWIFVVLTVASFGYVVYGLYNFYHYGNCDGPVASGMCVLTGITGDYGRFGEPRELVAPTSMDGIAAGNPDAPVIIVEFGCFLCPYTGQAETTMRELLKRPDIYYVFKPFPLPNHKNSYETAVAVLCANRQGKQWELRKEIFAQQMTCTVDGEVSIKELAEAAGLDMAGFNSCYDNKETGGELDGYIQQGNDAGIYATPTFFVNGKPLVGPQPIEEFEKLIEEAGWGET